MILNRNIYLKMKTLKETLKILFNQFPLTGILASETIPVQDAANRVLSEPASARLSSPGFHAAAMDGIAVKAEITFCASETMPKELIIDKDVFFIKRNFPWKMRRDSGFGNLPFTVVLVSRLRCPFLLGWPSGSIWIGNSAQLLGSCSFFWGWELPRHFAILGLPLRKAENCRSLA